MGYGYERVVATKIKVTEVTIMPNGIKKTHDEFVKELE